MPEQILSTWRTYILPHFGQPLDRLTLVADPDGLLIDEVIQATLRERGFELLSFNDPVAFRYIYEAHYRQRWDNQQSTPLVVILRTDQNTPGNLPFDIL